MLDLYSDVISIFQRLLHDRLTRGRSWVPNHLAIKVLMEIKVNFCLYNRGFKDLAVELREEVKTGETLDKCLERVLLSADEVKGVNGLVDEIEKRKNELKDLQLQIDRKTEEWNELARFLQAQGISNAKPLDFMPGLKKLAASVSEYIPAQNNLEDIPFESGGNVSEGEIVAEDGFTI